MTNVGIIDADLIGSKYHKFPNLACMKISSYQKSIGNNVSLVTDYSTVHDYDKIFLSKVFTKTDVPNWVLELPNCEYGGTGFFYDKAPPLPEEIEHSMPDYHLYDDWVDAKIRSGTKRTELEYYLDYSIGFLTRGCFRQCSFCVNQNYNKCIKHSPIEEFLDESRPKICLLDDNFLACKDWRQIIQNVKDTGKPFQFKQGLDERLLNKEKIHEIKSWKYTGDLIFSFDNIEDREIIERNLRIIYELYPKWRKSIKFYVLCGYDNSGAYGDEFWKKDLESTFQRIYILSKYSALSYIMRYEKCYSSKYSGIYSTIASWCNQPWMFREFSYESFCKIKGMQRKSGRYGRDVDQYLLDGNEKGAPWRYYDQLDYWFPAICYKYTHFVPKNVAIYGPCSNK